MVCDCYIEGKPGRHRYVLCQGHADIVRKSVDAEREACAKVAEAEAQVFLSPEYATGQPLSSHAERFACAQVARAIRDRSKT